MSLPFRITCANGRSYDVAISLLVVVAGGDADYRWQLECDLGGTVRLDLPPLIAVNPNWDMVDLANGDRCFEIDFTDGFKLEEEMDCE